MNEWSSVLSVLQDGSEDSVSLSSLQVDFSNSASTSVAPPATTAAATIGIAATGASGKSPKRRRKGSRKSRPRQEWEILEGLRDGQRCVDKPEKYQGFLMKRRKWPMKGWHKVSDVCVRGGGGGGLGGRRLNGFRVC